MQERSNRQRWIPGFGRRSLRGTGGWLVGWWGYLAVSERRRHIGKCIFCGCGTLSFLFHFSWAVTRGWGSAGYRRRWCAPFGPVINGHGCPGRFCLRRLTRVLSSVVCEFVFPWSSVLFNCAWIEWNLSWNVFLRTYFWISKCTWVL